jgi:hypothetical protein
MISGMRADRFPGEPMPPPSPEDETHGIPLHSLIQFNHSDLIITIAHDPMKHNSTKLLSILAAVAGTISVVRAETEFFTYTDGNLILGFQATSGQGSSQNVFFNLGKATDFRDNGNQGLLGNIGATLTATYGSDWYDRADLWFGVIANLNHQPNPPLIGSRQPVDGDPSRTFYISRAASVPGAASLIPAATYPPDILGIAGNKLRGLEQVLTPTSDGTGWKLSSTNEAERGIFKEEDGAGVLSLAIQEHATAWNNSWTEWNPTPGAAFSVITGGIQQNFGKGGSATYVDVQRVLATNTGASPTGVVGGGTYETTISISPAGAITSLTSSPPTSAYTTWIDMFNPPLTNPADRAAGADPDNDGYSNLAEFVLGGSPTASSQSIAPTLDTSGANFVFAFTRSAESKDEVGVVFQYGSSLTGWTDVTVPTADGVSVIEAATVTVSGTSVSVSVPKTSAVGGKLFGRLEFNLP